MFLKQFICRQLANTWAKKTQNSSNVSVFQLTPVGTTIFQGLRANDLDAGVNGLVEYSIVRGDGKRLGTDQGVGRDRVNVADGAEFFAINLPHQGQVTVNRSLDFERTQRYLVTVVATVSTICIYYMYLDITHHNSVTTILIVG